MTRPKFDGTITLGHLLTVFSLLTAGAAGYSKLQLSIAELQFQVQRAGDDFREMKEDLEELERDVRQLQMQARHK